MRGSVRVTRGFVAVCSVGLYDRARRARLWFGSAAGRLPIGRKEKGMKFRFSRVAPLIAAGAVIAAGVAFAGTATGAPAASYNIWLSYYNSSPYGIAQLNGAKAAASALGANLDAATPNNDPHLQQTQ